MTMKKINENAKITLTVGQLKRLVKEEMMHWEQPEDDLSNMTPQDYEDESWDDPENGVYFRYNADGILEKIADLFEDYEFTRMIDTDRDNGEITLKLKKTYGGSTYKIKITEVEE